MPVHDPGATEGRQQRGAPSLEGRLSHRCEIHRSSIAPAFSVGGGAAEAELFPAGGVPEAGEGRLEVLLLRVPRNEVWRVSAAAKQASR